MSSPYANLPPRNFWKTAVAQSHPLALSDVYRKKFDLAPGMRIATAGSCFAQHVARNLARRGFTVIDREPAPPGLSAELAHDHGFGLYSARYGNVYTARQLLQLAQEALGERVPQDAVWERAGRSVDALRPTVEPQGHASADAVRVHRRQHLGHVRSMLAEMDVLVFTLGLTEAWEHEGDGTVYPTASGTVARSPQPDRIRFRNFTAGETISDLRAFRDLVHRIRPGVRFLLTVSPVPLTATAEDQHVLVSTTYSKSVLRAAAGELAATCDDVDYFPSYELITAPCTRGFFFDANLRSVSAAGVDFVMGNFFAVHAPPAGASRADAAPAQASDTVCEDILLEAFAR